MDSDEAAHNEPPHLDLHSLQIELLYAYYIFILVALSV